jgi:hypothetical protein
MADGLNGCGRSVRRLTCPASCLGLSTRLASKQKWKLQVLEESITDDGGYKVSEEACRQSGRLLGGSDRKCDRS